MSSEKNMDEMLKVAQQHFNNGEYNLAEAILNQLILNNFKSAHVFHMLGSIYYDKGKFKKAIRAFKRALEIDPSFTDASVGLSIILNDLGRYEEGRKVFLEAQAVLQKKTPHSQLNEQLAQKHDELGQLYFQNQLYQEALEQYQKSLKLSHREPEITMNIVECYTRLGKTDKAFALLKNLCSKYPDFYGAQIRLGKLFFESHQIPEAIATWEEVLKKDPNNLSAQEHLRIANSIQTTSIEKEPPCPN